MRHCYWLALGWMSIYTGSDLHGLWQWLKLLQGWSEFPCYRTIVSCLWNLTVRPNFRRSHKGLKSGVQINPNPIVENRLDSKDIFTKLPHLDLFFFHSCGLSLKESWFQRLTWLYIGIPTWVYLRNQTVVNTIENRVYMATSTILLLVWHPENAGTWAIIPWPNMHALRIKGRTF